MYVQEYDRIARASCHRGGHLHDGMCGGCIRITKSYIGEYGGP